LYAALNAGFARSTGEIMGWLNASDLLQVMGCSRWEHFPWTARRGVDHRAADENQRDGDDHRCAADSAVVARALSGGANKYIQQESTFCGEACGSARVEG